MTMRLAFKTFVASTTFLCITFAAQAATAIGKVAAVSGSPSASGPSGSRVLKAGSSVFEDDKITVGNGNAQIILNDNTRLVVGPGSSLILDKFLMKGGNRAQKVSIKALRGTFRFITGRSNKNAYEIKTATATIGIRGTGFDFWQRGATGVAVLQGVVTLSSGKKSVTLEDNCEVGRAGGGSANEMALPNAAQNILNNLPYIVNQSGLRTPFRLPVENCNRTLQTLRAEGRSELPSPPPPPPPPAEGM